MTWQDKILLLLFLIIPSVIAVCYYIYCLITFFVRLEREEVEEGVTKEEFIKQHTPIEAPLKTEPKRSDKTEGQKLFERLRKEGKVPGLTYEQWNKMRVQPNDVELEIKK